MKPPRPSVLERYGVELALLALAALTAGGTFVEVRDEFIFLVFAIAVVAGFFLGCAVSRKGDW